jgi:hypothetical protein
VSSHYVRFDQDTFISLHGCSVRCLKN